MPGEHTLHTCAELEAKQGRQHTLVCVPRGCRCLHMTWDLQLVQGHMGCLALN
jgi:hypothetical protein